MKDPDYKNKNKITLLAVTPVQPKSLLLMLDQAIRNICFYVNAGKADFMCFKAIQCPCLSTIGLVSFLCLMSTLFNGISTFVGYLMPKPLSLKNSSGTI